MPHDFFRSLLETDFLYPRLPVATRTARTCVSLKSFEISCTLLWSAGPCSRFSVSTDLFTRSVVHGRKKSGAKPPRSKESAANNQQFREKT